MIYFNVKQDLSFYSQSIPAMDTHRWIRITSPRQQRSLGVGVGEGQDMASAVSPWRALLCYDKGQSKQDINRDVLKKEKHSAQRAKEGRFLSCVRDRVHP